MSSYFLWPVIMLRRPTFIGSAATAFSGSGSLVGRTAITGSAVIDVGGAASLRVAPPPFVGVAGIQVESTSVLTMTMVPILAGTANVTLSPESTLRMASKIAASAGIDIATTGQVFLDMRATSGIELGLAGIAFMSMRANALVQLDSSASLVMAAKMTGAEGFALDVSADMVMAAKMDAEEGFALNASASLLMASTFEGSAGRVLGATGDMVMAELFVGEQGLELGATGALLMASVLSGSASIELGESVTLTEVEPIIMEGVAGIEVGDATGDMVMALKMDGAAGVELATTGAMVMALKMEGSAGFELAMSGLIVEAVRMDASDGLVLDAAALLRTAAKMAGEDVITLAVPGATLRMADVLAGESLVELSMAAALKKSGGLAGAVDVVLANGATLTAPPPPTTSGLEAWWSLDEHVGDRADSSANGRDLTETEDPVTFNFGKVGDAAESEVDAPQILAIDSAASALAGGSEWTFVGWFYITSDGAPYYNMFCDIVRRYGGEGGWRIIVEADNGYNSNAFSINTDGGLIYITGWEVPADGWFFVAARRNGSELSISINNGTKLTATITGSTGTLSGEFRLLSNAGAHSDALADECAVWSSALTDAQITWLYNSGNGREFADLPS